jgi:uncharacterized DUF497 family protein
LAYTVTVKVTWDRAKNLPTRRSTASLLKKPASRAGADYLELFDDAHSDDEDRFIAIGPIKRGLVLVVWTERDQDVVRIISARWATPSERSLFRSHLKKHT